MNENTKSAPPSSSSNGGATTGVSQSNTIRTTQHHHHQPFFGQPFTVGGGHHHPPAGYTAAHAAQISNDVGGGTVPHFPMVLPTPLSEQHKPTATRNHHLPLIQPSAPIPAPHVFAPSQSATVPAAFKNRLLRSGKWIKEEEEYAETLVELFEKGHATECENGLTLRAYLSQKLHCAPMRISKKFAGKGIGKMTFLSKIGIPLDEGSAAEVQRLKKEIEVREKRFMDAAFPTTDFFGVSGSRSVWRRLGRWKGVTSLSACVELGSRYVASPRFRFSLF